MNSLSILGDTAHDPHPSDKVYLGSTPEGMSSATTAHRKWPKSSSDAPGTRGSCHTGEGERRLLDVGYVNLPPSLGGEQSPGGGEANWWGGEPVDGVGAQDVDK